MGLEWRAKSARALLALARRLDPALLRGALEAE
jgi:hypothetical protein